MFNIFKKKSGGGDSSAVNFGAGANSVAANLENVKFKIGGMHCTSCSLNIDGELEDLDGVKSASTSYAKSVTKVEFDPKLVSKKKLVAAIEGLDYSVEEVK